MRNIEDTEVGWGRGYICIQIQLVQSCVINIHKKLVHMKLQCI